jgi:hypothetical protein
MFETQPNNSFIAFTSFKRHLDDHKRSGIEQLCSNKFAVWAVFSTEEGGKLADYITSASTVLCGLKREGIMKLAY